VRRNVRKELAVGRNFGFDESERAVLYQVGHVRVWFGMIFNPLVVESVVVVVACVHHVGSSIRSVTVQAVVLTPAENKATSRTHHLAPLDNSPC
jgi:hypothetical protein